ncbi:ATP-dependent protease subunit HslV [Coccomyxa sp. Obi]|nr:ATP-dependent protease subunit HslV [Coccomyxa sp. Obi]
MQSRLKTALKLSSAVTGCSTSWSPMLLQGSLRSLHNEYRGTTVLSVRKGDKVIIMADGQVTRGSEIMKPNVKKVRSMFDGKVIGGFAGATADAFTLFERLETQLESNSGQLKRAAVELAKSWRLDKYLRRLDATMIVADAKESLTITGNGDVVEPHDGVIAIGSGGPYALAAARALIDLPDYDAKAIADKSMKIAADTCIYTNHNFTYLTLESEVTDPQ